MGIDAKPAVAGAKSFETSAKRAGNAALGMGRKTDRVTKSMVGLRSTALSLQSILPGLGAAFVLRGAIRQLSSFEKSMSEVEALLGPERAGGAMADLTAKAREMGAQTVFSAQQAAEGMKFLTLAGFTASETLGAIKPALDLAAAGGLALGKSADILSNIMSAFQIEANKAVDAADALAVTASQSNTSILQLGEAMKFVAPVAANVGVTMQDTAAALGILGNAGLQASLAGTSLRKVMASVIKPTGLARGALADMGIDAGNLAAMLSDPNQGINAVVQLMAERGLSAAKAFEIFGLRGGPAMLALVSQAPKLAQLTKNVNDAEGAVAQMAKTMQDNLAGDTRQAISALSELNLQIGDAGLLSSLRNTTQGITGFLRGLTGIATNMDEASDAMKSGIKVGQKLLENIDLIKKGFLLLAGIITGKLVAPLILAGLSALKSAGQFALMTVQTVRLQIGLATLGGASRVAATGLGVVSVATTALGAAMRFLLGPAGIILSVAAAFLTFGSSADASSNALENFTGVQNSFQIAIGESGEKLEELLNKTEAVTSLRARSLGILRQVADDEENLKNKLVESIGVFSAANSTFNTFGRVTADVSATAQDMLKRIEEGTLSLAGAIVEANRLSIADDRFNDLAKALNSISLESSKLKDASAGANDILAVLNGTADDATRASLGLAAATKELTEDEKALAAELKRIQQDLPPLINQFDQLFLKLVPLEGATRQYREQSELLKDIQDQIANGSPTVIAAFASQGVTAEAVAAALKELNVQFDEARLKADPLLAATVEQAEAFKTLQGALDPLAKAEQTFNDRTDTINATLKTLAVGTPEARTMLEDLGITFESVQAQADALNISYEEQVRKLEETAAGTIKLKAEQDKANSIFLKALKTYDPVNAALIENRNSVNELELALRTLGKTDEEIIAITARFREELERTNTGLEDGCKKAQENQGCVTAWGKALTGMIEDLDRSFVELWEGAFSGFDDFGKNILSSFKKFGAQLLHQSLTRPFLEGFENLVTGAPGAGGGQGAGLFGGGSFFDFFKGGGGKAAAGAGTPLGAAGAGIVGPGAGGAGGAAAGAGVSGFGAAFAGIGGGIVAGSLVGSIFGNAGGTQTTILAGIGAGIGFAIGGPIGALIGGVGGGLVSAIIGGKKTQIGGGIELDINSGRVGGSGFETIKKKGGLFSSTKISDKATSLSGGITSPIQESLNASAQAINKLVEGLVDSPNIGRFFSGSARIDTFEKSPEQIQAEIDKLLIDTVANGIRRFVRESDDFSASMKILVGSLNASNEALIRAFEAAIAFERVLNIDPIADAITEFENSFKSATTRVTEGTDAIIELASTFDGSVEDVQELTIAFTNQKKAIFDLALALQDVALQSSNLFAATAQNIREALLNEEELFALRRTQVDALVEQLSMTTDPFQIATLSESINSLTQSAFGGLDAGQQTALAPEFLTFLDEVAALVGEQTATGLELLDLEAARLDGGTEGGLAISAAELQQQAVTEFGGFVGQFGGFVQDMIDLGFSSGSFGVLSSAGGSHGATGSAIELRQF